MFIVIPTLEEIKHIAELTDKELEARIIENILDDIEESRIDFD